MMLREPTVFGRHTSNMIIHHCLKMGGFKRGLAYCGAEKPYFIRPTIYWDRVTCDKCLMAKTLVNNLARELEKL